MFSRSHMSYEALALPGRADLSDAEALGTAIAAHDDIRTRNSTRGFSDAPDAPVALNAIETHVNAAEADQHAFNAGGADDEWINALEPTGTDGDKPHLTTAPWLTVVVAQRWGQSDDGTRFKTGNVPKSMGFATGVLIASLRRVGASVLTHAPKSMKFLNKALIRPASERVAMILAVGHPALDATVTAGAKLKKPQTKILGVQD